MNRGDHFRLRIADLPVVIRKLRKPQRCIVDATPIEAGALAGTIAIRRREGRTWVHLQQYVCAGCVASRCDAAPPQFLQRETLARVARDGMHVRETHWETGGALPWEE